MMLTQLLLRTRASVLNSVSGLLRHELSEMSSKWDTFVNFRQRRFVSFNVPPFPPSKASTLTDRNINLCLLSLVPHSPGALKTLIVLAPVMESVHECVLASAEHWILYDICMQIVFNCQAHANDTPNTSSRSSHRQYDNT